MYPTQLWDIRRNIEAAEKEVLNTEKIKNDQPKPIVGAAAAVVGQLQAIESIKYLCGIENILKNCVLSVNLIKHEYRKIALKKNPHCAVCSPR